MNGHTASTARKLREREMHMMLSSQSLFSFSSLGPPPTHGTVPPTFWVNLPSSVKSLQKQPQRHPNLSFDGDAIKQ